MYVLKQSKNLISWKIIDLMFIDMVSFSLRKQNTSNLCSHKHTNFISVKWFPYPPSKHCTYILITKYWSYFRNKHIFFQWFCQNTCLVMHWNLLKCYIPFWHRKLWKASPSWPETKVGNKMCPAWN